MASWIVLYHFLTIQKFTSQKAPSVSVGSEIEWAQSPAGTLNLFLGKVTLDYFHLLFTLRK